MAERPWRIAHLQLLPLLSGVQRVSLQTLTALDRERFAPLLICARPGPLSDEARRLGLPVRFASWLRRPIAPFADGLALAELTALARRERLDLLHTHSSKTGFLGRVAGRLAGLRAVVHTVHGFPFAAAGSTPKRLVYRGLEAVAGRMCDALVVLKPEDAATARRLGVPSGRIHLLPNAVDTARFAPPRPGRRKAVRAGLGWSGLRVVGAVGRLCAQKQPLALIAAAQRLPRARFAWIGDGPMMDEVAAAVEAAGLLGRFELLGWRQDIPGLLGALDVFVLPSLWEGLPLALLEAQACGLPVVASAIPGNRDAVAHEVDGLLAAPYPEELAAAIDRLLTEPALARRLGHAARARLEAMLSPEARAARLAELYLSLLEGPDAGAAPGAGRAPAGRP